MARTLPPLHLPAYVPPRESLSRPSAERINRAGTPPQEVTLTLAGYDEVIPLVYGEDRMSGYWLVRPYTHIGTGDLRFAMAWSWGGQAGIEGVQQIYINGAALPGGVTVTHYRGTPDQTIDPTLAADIPGFGDAYKYLAYTVFSIPAGTINGFPQQYQIEAVVRGIKVLDERITPTPPVEARYWGVRVTDSFYNGSPNYPQFYIAELDMRSSVGGSSEIGSGTAGASAGAPAANAFDGNPATIYSSGNGNNLPIILFYDFGVPIVIEEMVMQAITGSPAASRSPTGFDVVYSDDGSTWTTLTSFFPAAWSSGEIRNYIFNQTGNVVYSNNPALCMADFITRPERIGGLEKEALNVEACADRCDELVGSDRRCEIGLTIKNADYANVMLDMLCAYAEVLWSYQGGDVFMVPDAPVPYPAAILTSDDVIENTLMIRGKNAVLAPTSVTINYRQPTGTAESWNQEPATQALPGVDTGDIDNIPSGLDMPGLHRFSEAARKALMRLRRLSHPAIYPLQVFDEGVRFQRGDVIQLPDEKGMTDALVRVLSKEEIAEGIYQLTCEHYDDDMYPDDFIPGDSASWPEGTGFFFKGAVLPFGYEFFTGADGYPLFGASVTHPAGTIAGDGVIDYGTQSTSSDGAHGGTGEGEWINGPASPPSGGPSLPRYVADVPGHAHSYSQTGPYSRTPFRRQERIIVKTGGPGDMPAQAECMADGPIISAILSEVTSHLGRLAAGGAAGNAGQALSFSPSSAPGLQPVFSLAGAHNHQLGTGQGQPGPWFGPFPPAWFHASAGNHGHSATLDFSLNIKRARLAFFESSASCPAQTGLIGMYFGDPGDLAGTGFWLCDGDNGTIDLEDYFVERSSVAGAGTQIGDHTFSYSGTTSVHTHSHQGARSDMYGRTGMHQGNHSHNHSVSGSGPYRPPGFSVYFIQYTGVI